MDLDGKYGDVMELSFFNAAMTGMSTCGKRFTYVNQLASSQNDLSKRAEWFTCACCPPNITRLLGYMGGYLWTFATEEQTNSVQVNVHLYGSATLKVPLESGSVEVEQKSNWPWDGDIDFSIRTPSDVSTIIKIRIPGWATNWEVRDSNICKLDAC